MFVGDRNKSSNFTLLIMIIETVFSVSHLTKQSSPQEGKRAVNIALHYSNIITGKIRK